jgi:glycosyltransferase involved in cell wall biosynthesis
MNTKANRDTPLVSVIIPAYNAASMIERTIQSVLSQTYPFYEILVIDDGSCDETSDVVSKLSADEERITLSQQENQGVAAARNYGIKHAIGDYIAPLDADDLWFPEKLERQISVMLQSPATVGLVYAWSVPVSDDARTPNYVPGGMLEGVVFLPLLLGNLMPSASTPLIRRKCFDHVGMYNSDFRELDAQGCEDWDLYLRIAEHYEFRVVAQHLVGYWQSAESMSADWKLMDRSYRLLMGWIRKRHPEIPVIVFRWSKSSYLLYLANGAARAQQTAASLWLLSQSTALDPFMLTNLRLYRMLVKNLLHLVWRAKMPPRSGGMQKIETGDDRRMNRKSATGWVWARHLKQRTQRLVQLQKDLRLDVMTNIDTGKPDRRRQS